jgi:hypothetical protein
MFNWRHARASGPKVRPAAAPQSAGA